VSFPDEALSRNGFLGGRLQIFQPIAGYRAATDPVLLAAFTPARPGDRVLDLGCGAGTAGLCLARRVGEIDLHGLEFQPDYADLARRNAVENDLRMTVHGGDLRWPPGALKRLSFNQVLMNPPFYRPHQATGSRDTGRDTAQREGVAGLGDWISTGLRRLAPKGSLVIIHRTERLAEILAALTGGAGAVEILPLSARAGRPASRVLVRGRKGSGAPLTLHPPFILHEGSAHLRDGDDYSPEARRVLRGLSALPPVNP
jgi:tRNA1Val (adenine37-N6)-methyltransferase